MSRVCPWRCRSASRSLFQVRWLRHRRLHRSRPHPVLVEAFVDVTQRLGVNFQYHASHTSKKYLAGDYGAGRRAIRLRQ